MHINDLLQLEKDIAKPNSKEMVGIEEDSNEFQLVDESSKKQTTEKESPIKSSSTMNEPVGIKKITLTEAQQKDLKRKFNKYDQQFEPKK